MASGNKHAMAVEGREVLGRPPMLALGQRVEHVAGWLTPQ